MQGSSNTANTVDTEAAAAADRTEAIMAAVAAVADEEGATEVVTGEAAAVAGAHEVEFHVLGTASEA